MTLIVNGEKIEDTMIADEFQRLKPEYEQVFADQSPDEQKTQLTDWSKENVIERVLICQEAKNNGPDIRPEEIDSALAEMKEQYKQQGRELKDRTEDEEKQLRENTELQLKIKHLTDNIYKSLTPPTEKAIRAFYEENKEQLQTEEQIRVAHIVKHVDGRTDEAAARQEIAKIHDAIQNGSPFETQAAKNSDCPDKGGDLGYITRGKMVEEFEDVVFNLDTGQTSGIFQTRFGFHIAKLYDRKPSITAKLEEVKDQITQKLTQDTQSKAVEDFIDQLKEKAKIEDI